MKDEKTVARRAELAAHRERQRERHQTMHQTLHHTPAWLKDALDKFKGIRYSCSCYENAFKSEYNQNKADEKDY